MSRNPPLNLPDPQRNALSEFLAGHISAGQLSDRVRAQSQPAPRRTSTRMRSQQTPRRAAALAVVAAIGGAGIAAAGGAGQLGAAKPGTAAAHPPAPSKPSAAPHPQKRRPP